MLSERLDHDALYEALIARDASYDGRVYVGVTTTGIFCRLTCPARKPLRSNCRFFFSVTDCLEAGFRPCKRCRPLAPTGQADPTMAMLLKVLEQDPSRRWSEADIVALGLDPSTVRRSFKRHYGSTFLEMARMARLGSGFVALSAGGSVIDAQMEAGFESASGFRDAFARLLGQSPGHFSGRERVKADWIDTPLGAMIAVCDRSSLHLLEFIDRKALPRELSRLRQAVGGDLGIGRFETTDSIEAELTDFFGRRRARFETPMVMHGSTFTQTVWEALRRIPAGATRSYGDLAREIGRPSATRAVARANGANQIAIAIPCHRVIGADGSLTGYGGGMWRKQKLIELERHFAEASHMEAS